MRHLDFGYLAGIQQNFLHCQILFLHKRVGIFDPGLVIRLVVIRINMTIF